jgi:hypothetical protein
VLEDLKERSLWWNRMHAREEAQAKRSLADGHQSDQGTEGKWQSDGEAQPPFEARTKAKETRGEKGNPGKSGLAHRVAAAEERDGTTEEGAEDFGSSPATRDSSQQTGMSDRLTDLISAIAGKSRRRPGRRHFVEFWLNTSSTM